MTLLSPRLLCCASMVTGAFVCDIGTDHAFLPAFLVSSGKCSRAIAADIRRGPLESAAETVRKAGLSGSVQLILSDGFEQIPPEGITDAVIAGMGGETVCAILSAESAAFLKQGVNLILQPMTKAEILREWLAANGFALLCEKAVRDVHLYTVMQAKYDGKPRRLSETERWCGALRSEDPAAHDYLSGIAARLQKKQTGLESAGMRKEAEGVRDSIRAIMTYLKPENG